MSIRRFMLALAALVLATPLCRAQGLFEDAGLKPRPQTPTTRPAPATRALPPGHVAAGKLLLLFPKNELPTAEEACKALGLSYDVAAKFDVAADYSPYGTILSGSNKMDYWGEKPERKTPEAFQNVDAFLRGGGHLVVFGTFNGRNLEQLKPYGITTSYYHGGFFETVPGVSELLFQGNEALIPEDRRLHTAGNFKCSAPHVVLLKRVPKEEAKADGPLMVTLPVDRGRLTLNLVEPAWKQPRDGLWLITVTLSWVSRGSPIGAGKP